MIQYASAAPGESASRAVGPAHRPVRRHRLSRWRSWLGALGTGPAQAAVPDPVAPETPPALVEGFSPYLPQVSCDPVAKPGTLALRSMLLAHLRRPRPGHHPRLRHRCDQRAQGGPGLGLGAERRGAGREGGRRPVPDLAAGARAATAWPRYNARRLGVMYVIWNGRIWSSYRAGGRAGAPTAAASRTPTTSTSRCPGPARQAHLVVDRARRPGRLRPLPARSQGNPAPPWSRAARDPVPGPDRPDDPDGHAAARAATPPAPTSSSCSGCCR